MSEPNQESDWIDELVDASLARGRFTLDENGDRQYAVTPRMMISVIDDDERGDDHRNCSICRGLTSTTKFVPDQQ